VTVAHFFLFLFYMNFWSGGVRVSFIPVNSYGIEHLSKLYAIAELLINCLQIKVLKALINALWMHKLWSVCKVVWPFILEHCYTSQNLLWTNAEYKIRIKGQAWWQQLFHQRFKKLTLMQCTPPSVLDFIWYLPIIFNPPLLSLQSYFILRCQ